VLADAVGYGDGRDFGAHGVGRSVGGFFLVAMGRVWFSAVGLWEIEVAGVSCCW
jgi:hypothetical protein